MHKNDTKRKRKKRVIGAESISVLTLCLLLCGVYWVAVTLGNNYGRKLSDSEKSTAAVMAVGNFISQNEGLAAFLGLKMPDVTNNAPVNQDDGSEIQRKAREYIKYCNALYSDGTNEEELQ